jgi:cobalt/nickel transport system ATP-binding protein
MEDNMTTENIIELRDVKFAYRHDRLALAGVSVALPAGKRIAILGPNGAGKSTLFLHINAILRPQSGGLFYQGQPYSYSRRAVSTLRQKIGLVFQDADTQLFAATVFEDVIFGPCNLGLPVKDARKRAEAALAAVDMFDYKNEPIHFLSPGQKKRVAIAGVLAMNPEVLVMDEPTAGLDYPGLVSLQAILARLQQEGKTIVVATHDVDWAWEWADIVCVMVEGRVIATGSPIDILNRNDNNQCGFAKPIIGEVYNNLLDKKLVARQIKNRIPRNVSELVAMLGKN